VEEVEVEVEEVQAISICSKTSSGTDFYACPGDDP
jgi:hypothetical protein